MSGERAGRPGPEDSPGGSGSSVHSGEDAYRVGHGLREFRRRDDLDVDAEPQQLTAPNTFPRLPIRDGENVAAIFTSCPDESACRHHLADALARPLARDEILPGTEREQTTAPRILRLAPTGRSVLS